MSRFDRAEAFAELDNLIREPAVNEPLPEPTEFGAVVQAGVVSLVARYRFVNRGDNLWSREGKYGNESYYWWSDLISPRKVN